MLEAINNFLLGGVLEDINSILSGEHPGDRGVLIVVVGLFISSRLLGLITLDGVIRMLLLLLDWLLRFTWTPVTARLTRRELVFQKVEYDTDGDPYNSYEVCVNYEYEIDNKTYTAHRIAFGLPTQGITEEYANGILKRVPQQPTLTVYVNPRKPEDVVISRVGSNDFLTFTERLVIIAGLAAMTLMADFGRQVHFLEWRESPFDSF